MRSMQKKSPDTIRTFQFFCTILTNKSWPSIGTNFKGGLFLGFGHSRMLDFRISLIERIQGFSLDLGFKYVGFVKDWNRGFSSDVGFWFFFRILIQSFLKLGFSGTGSESSIDHTNYTNIQIGRSQHKRIIALFIRSGNYGRDRKNTKAATGFFVIFLEGS